jgi:hypothetical protein
MKEIDGIEFLDSYEYYRCNPFVRYFRESYDNLYIIIQHLWHEETTPATVAAHLCFMVVSSFAFFLFVMFASMSIGNSNPISNWFDVVNALYKASNFFLNLLFLLIIIELSQMISIAYYNWKRDNL